jgi:SAM-dependent methyltransferase
MENTVENKLNQNDAESVRERVRAGYGEIARATPKAKPGSSCGCSPSPCCGSTTTTADKLAQQIGYSAAELAGLPEGANMGLSCGNPTALAAMKPGEVVVDLGSGGGFDVFLAGPRVGPTGRVIGVDMTPDMLTKARRNIDGYRRRTNLDNVEFRLGEIEHLPVADNTVDVVISNCVINLSPDKPQVWRDIARVLKPGGRVAVSDLALLLPLPKEIQEMVRAWVGCVAGAMLVSEMERCAREAGLIDIHLEQKGDYFEAAAAHEDPLFKQIAAALPKGTRPSDYVTSLNITARKRA